LTTKEWLSRATNIDKEIGRLLRERRAAWDRAVSVTSRLNANNVSGTKDPHKYDTLVAYENLIDAKVDELYAIKQEIMAAINNVQDSTLRALLTERYINGKKWEQIAIDLNYSWRQIIRLHGRALQEITIPKDDT
jgi:DNA-directed RNA polymerase specialized sigma subunit